MFERLSTPPSLRATSTCLRGGVCPVSGGEVSNSGAKVQHFFDINKFFGRFVGRIFYFGSLLLFGMIFVEIIVGDNMS